ncbi:uncharacterized protein MONBRDRAFT_35996 [Monosiga brevicollis MX1]|uniref:Profilin n=1 Tax=Monosiga brevicollis TaxID=81824 RepID=A9UR87_MONBE|nr:uncharacterized protein MONBRDRAFT_35996 [Monosiga brevicollis MX1]EDQ91881.1 predicted protein [Monosiga brevicollis MX1]|eukprot:XP_001743167.1 hypothetical protein [Monosiga brevicollis MX1]
MSWQTYIDQSLLGSGHVSKAAIHGHDGNPWATSAGFNVTQEEAVAAFRGIADPGPLTMSGIKLGGQKYMFLRNNDGRSVYGRKGGDAGCVVVKTGKAIVIGIYEGGLQAGACANVVESLGDYLINAGF